MKKVLLLVIGLLLFVPTIKADSESALVLDNYNIEVDIKDDGQVDIKQSFNTTELDDQTDFSLKLSKNYNATASNFFEIPNYNDPNTKIDDIQYLVKLKDDQYYYIDYTIKSDDMIRQKQVISIIPILSYSRYTEYKNFKFKITYTDNNKIDIEKFKQESMLEGFELSEDGNTITGEQIAPIVKYYSGQDTDSPIIRFDAKIGELDINDINSLDNIFYAQGLIALVIITISFCKLITKNNVYNPIMIGLLIAEAVVFSIGLVSKSKDVSIIVEGILLVLFYSVFIGTISFGKQVPHIVIRIPILLFIFFHSFMMITGFTGGEFTMTKLLSFGMLYLSIFFVTIAYNLGKNIIINKNRS